MIPKQSLKIPKKSLLTDVMSPQIKKSQLESGKTELNSKKDATTKQLAEAETKLLTAKADAEGGKDALTVLKSRLQKRQ